VEAQETKEIAKDFTPWGNVTNPKNHNPAKYRYLVHAINPAAKISMSRTSMDVIHDQKNMIDEEEGDQSINLYSQPERLAERVALSCSLIDESHYGTWGKVGLIIEFPPENVSITSSSDAGAFVMSKKLLEEQARKNPILTAEQLLKQTHSSSYNEIVIIANKDGKKIRLAGFFYKASDDGKPLDEGLFQKIKDNAERLNLPLVPLTEPNPFEENEITTDKNGNISVSFEGKNYSLFSHPIWGFKYLDAQRDLVFFCSPEEIGKILAYLSKNNIDNKKIEQIRKEYAKINEERNKPKVKYDDKREISVINKIIGYGESEKENRVFENGYEVRTLDEARAMSRMMSDPSGHRDNNLYDNKLNPQTALGVIEEALNNASVEEKVKIEAWRDKIMPKLKENWER
jgi:hypothetical protein